MLGVVVGDDMTRVELARRADDPVVVREDADVTQARDGVDEGELRDAHRIVAIDEDVELVMDALVGPGEPRHAGSCRIRIRPLVGRPRQRPGVGDHARPVSSSRT